MTWLSNSVHHGKFPLKLNEIRIILLPISETISNFPKKLQYKIHLCDDRILELNMYSQLRCETKNVYNITIKIKLQY